MRSAHSDLTNVLQISAACQEAIQAQRERECRHGYGLDDYTEGRIVGAANLARKILRLLAGGQVDPSSLGVRPRQAVGR